MTRNHNGRFAKGCSGNPRGRPRKPKRPFTPEQFRIDLLEAMEKDLVVTVGGKRKKQPIIKWINEQLLVKAAKGNERCMFKAIEWRKQLLTEVLSERDALVDLQRKLLETYERDPDELTDKEIELLHTMHAYWDPYLVI